MQTCGEHVRQLGTKPVASSRCLFLVVIVVGAGQQVAKDQFRNINPMFGMYLNWNTSAIVPDGDPVFFSIDLHLQAFAEAN